jgi:hypothetical protein
VCFKGVSSLFRKISRGYIGISRRDIGDVLKTFELKQIKRTTQTRDLKPIVEAVRPNQYFQADLVDFSKLDYNKHNNGYTYILNVIEIYSKFLWSFPLKNKTVEVVVYNIQNF